MASDYFTKNDCTFVDDSYDLGTEICGIKVVDHIVDLSKPFADFKLLSYLLVTMLSEKKYITKPKKLVTNFRI